MKAHGVAWIGTTALVAAGACQSSLPSSASLPSRARLPQTIAASSQGENQPEYWTRQLAQKESRPRAIEQLERMFEDALAAAPNPAPQHSKSDTPKVKALVDQMIEPLVETYAEGHADLDAASRVRCIKLIAGFGDPRGEPAFRTALEDFVARPRTKPEDEDIKWAIRAQRDLKLPRLSPLVLQVFQRLEVHTLLGGIIYKDLQDTMAGAPEKAWAEPLKTMLQPEIEPPKQQDWNSFDKFRDQLFWQTVACLVLGKIGDPSAVTPLMKVIVDPNKANAATTAVLALVKIGKPSVDAAVKLLKGESKELEGQVQWYAHAAWCCRCRR